LRTAANIQPTSPPTNFVREPMAQVHTQQLAKVELTTPKAESTPPPVKSPEPRPPQSPQEIHVTMDVPVTKTVTDVSPAPSTLANIPPALVDSESPASSLAMQPERAASSEPRSTQPEEKRSLADRLNPANWFTRGRSPPITTPLDSYPRNAPQAGSSLRTNSVAQPISTPKASSSPESALKKEEPANNLPAPWPRYSYHSTEEPVHGDRARALDAVARGVESHRQRKISDAVQAYREAAQLDPSFFEAHYNLGLAAYELKNWPLSLSAYETALSINPTSTNARFNFAVVLERAGYLLDAVDQLEKTINQHPDETRAHFSLARISAEQLNQPNAAIRHYQKVLELEPQHPQASAIRQWLLAQPLR
jgi:tetratricopeptide (TPR) repeat protein